MSLKDQITEDMKTAMRCRYADVTGTLLPVLCLACATVEVAEKEGGVRAGSCLSSFLNLRARWGVQQTSISYSRKR